MPYRPATETADGLTRIGFFRSFMPGVRCVPVAALLAMAAVPLSAATAADADLIKRLRIMKSCENCDLSGADLSNSRRTS